MKELLGQIQKTSLDGIIKYGCESSPAPEYDGTITIEGEPKPSPTYVLEYDGTITVVGDPVVPEVPETVPEYDGTITVV